MMEAERRLVEACGMAVLGALLFAGLNVVMAYNTWQKAIALCQ